MAEDGLSFALLFISSILIIVNPLGATLIYVSLQQIWSDLHGMQ
ncbi:MAG: hypothetical protein WC620_02175 [Methanoregula sp.]|jgi:hypothetical protein